MAMRIQTLGGLKVWENGSPSGLPGAPKRCAFVLVPAVQGSVPCDTALELFWDHGEKEDLNKRLHEVRKFVGPSVVIRDRDVLHIGPDVHVDAVDFERALKRGDIDDASQIYRGDFLSHVTFSDVGRGFSKWVDATRDRLRDGFVECQKARIEARVRIGDIAGALAIARGWSADFPGDDDALAGLIRLQARSGMRNEARRQCEDYQRRIRKDRSRAHPDILEIAEGLEDGTFRADAVPSATSPTFDLLRARAGVLVLPIKNDSPAPNPYDFFCEGLAEEINRALGKVPNIRVVPRSSAVAVSQMAVKLRDKAINVGVTHALEASARLSATGYAISVHLFAAEGEELLWSEGYEEQFEPKDHDTRLYEVQNRIAADVTSRFTRSLTATTTNPGVPAAGMPRPGETTNPRARLLYQRGRCDWHERTHGKLHEAMRWFGEALAIDPSFARAHCGVADVLCVMSGYDYTMGAPNDLFPRALKSVNTAMAIDPFLSDAHAALGNYLANYEWEWGGAEFHLKRAIDLNPGSSTARQWYSNYLTTVGDANSGVLEATRALELDPRSGYLSSSLARHYQLMRQPAAAIEEYRHALRLLDFPSARCGLAVALLQNDQAGEGLEELKKLEEGLPNVPIILALNSYALGRAGQEKDARARLHALLFPKTSFFVPPELVALCYLGLDEPDYAIKYLEKALEVRSQVMTLIHIEPLFDPLRGEKRFQRLVDAVGAQAVAAVGELC
jgi:TolB-like protein/DNA-binding SARP family transcriptional activator